MATSHTPSLYDVLYDPRIRRNLLSLFCLTDFDLYLGIEYNCIRIYLEALSCGGEHNLDGFISIDIDDPFINLFK